MKVEDVPLDRRMPRSRFPVKNEEIAVSRARVPRRKVSVRDAALNRGAAQLALCFLKHALPQVLPLPVQPRREPSPTGTHFLDQFMARPLDSMNAAQSLEKRSE